MYRIHGLLAILIAIPACAPRGAAAPVASDAGVAAASAPHVHSLSQVDARPRLVGCPGHNETGDAWVTFEFIVRANGTVDPGSVTLVRRRSGSRAAEVVRRAEQAASTCVYEPALKDGEPVAVRVQRLFSMASPQGT